MRIKMLEDYLRLAKQKQFGRSSVSADPTAALL